MVRQDDNPIRAHREKHISKPGDGAVERSHQISRNKEGFVGLQVTRRSPRKYAGVESNSLTGLLVVLYGLTKRGSVEPYRAKFPKVCGVAGTQPPFSGRGC